MKANMLVKAKRLLNRFSKIDYSTLDQSVLNTQELQQLREWAIENCQHHSQSFNRIRQAYGEKESPKLGNGLDFEHSRIYLPGDERKHINWRLSARTQEIHVKQFNEFQQSKVFIFIDNFTNMRFGTRRRTKIAQAIRAALYSAHTASLRHSQVSVYVVEPGPNPTQPCFEYSDVESCINRPYPPVSVQKEKESVEIWRDFLSAVDSTYHLLIVISDFHFLGDRNADSWKNFSQSVHAGATLAIQIQDPVECDLPENGTYTLSDSEGIEARECNLASIELRENYSRSAAVFYKTIEDRLKITFMQTIKLLSNEERIDILLHNPLMHFM